MASYTLELNEPWTVLNVRGNPEAGRRLTFRYEDGTVFVVDVTLQQMQDKALIEARLQEQIKAHEALKAL